MNFGDQIRKALGMPVKDEEEHEPFFVRDEKRFYRLQAKSAVSQRRKTNRRLRKAARVAAYNREILAAQIRVLESTDPKQAAMKRNVVQALTARYWAEQNGHLALTSPTEIAALREAINA